MGSIDYGLGDYGMQRKRPRTRLGEGDRERIEDELRVTHQEYEADQAKAVRLDMLEGYDRFYVNDPAGAPIDIAELRDMVNRDLL